MKQVSVRKWDNAQAIDKITEFINNDEIRNAYEIFNYYSMALKVRHLPKEAEHQIIEVSNEICFLTHVDMEEIKR